MNIPELPIQVVAVTDAPATNYHHTQELNQVLVAEVITIITVTSLVILFFLKEESWPCFPLVLFYFHHFSTSWYTPHLDFVKIYA